MLRRLAFLLAIVWAAPVSVFAAEPVDLAMVGRIRYEAFTNSTVMDTLAELTDVIGPRVTGSPQMKQANEWTRQRLESWGLQDAHLESWGPFGEGWTLEHVSVHMVAPSEAPLMALPKAWTPGTQGVVRGELVQVTLDSEEDLEKHTGTLAGKILLLKEASELKRNEEPLLERYGEQELEELAKYEVPTGPQDQWRKGLAQRITFAKVLRPFLEEEKVVATLEPSSRDGGTVRVGRGGSREPGEPRGVASLVMAVEQYNRLLRLVERKLDVGLPGFQFIQDDVEYSSLTHHTNLDVYDRVKREDLMQAAAVLTTFAYHAATRDGLLPRKPMPDPEREP